MIDITWRKEKNNAILSVTWLLNEYHLFLFSTVFEIGNDEWQKKILELAVLDMGYRYINNTF